MDRRWPSGVCASGKRSVSFWTQAGTKLVNDGFAGGQQIVDKLMGIDFVGQRIVGHDGLRLGETGFQTGDDGL